LSWIDTLVGFLSPRAQFQRLRYRQAIEAAGNASEIVRKYDAASKGRRTDGWQTTALSANAENKSAIAVLRYRARDLVRNNPYARRGVRVIGSNVVGKGIRASISGASETQTRKISEVWELWAGTTEIDFDGKSNIYGLQRLVMEMVVESGEALIRRRFLPGDNFPMKIQILEPDFLNTNLSSQAENGNRIIQGIEIDSEDQIQAYHLFESHPGNLDSLVLSGIGMKSIRVPATEIQHIYLVERAGQMRGVSWFAPVMIKLKDFDDYEDAQLVRQKIAACFSVFVSDIAGLEEPASEAQKDVLGQKVEPGIIEILPPGKTVTFASPPGVENYGEYTTIVLRAIATGLGVSYEALTGDLSQVNFSSGRMGWLEFQRNIDVWRDALMNAQFNNRLFKWFSETAPLVGLSMNKVKTEWVAPRREMIDPTKEVPSKILAIRAGLETLEDAIYANGKIPVQQFEQIKATNDLIDKLGLVLDSDPRTGNNSGNNNSNSNSMDDELTAKQQRPKRNNGQTLSA